MLRKIKRNIARNYLKESGHKKINKHFSENWKEAFIYGEQKILQKNGKRVAVVRRRTNESTNS